MKRSHCEILTCEAGHPRGGISTHGGCGNMGDGMIPGGLSLS